MPGVFAPADRRIVEPSHLIGDRLAFEDGFGWPLVLKIIPAAQFLNRTSDA